MQTATNTYEGTTTHEAHCKHTRQGEPEKRPAVKEGAMLKSEGKRSGRRNSKYKEINACCEQEREQCG